MDTTGHHLLAEFWDCNIEILEDLEKIESLMRHAAHVAGARVVNAVFHRFSPQGITGVVVVEESHLSIHTWPEAGYAAVDIFTCGNCSPELAFEFLKEGLSAEHSEYVSMIRGLQGPRSMRVASHRQENPIKQFSPRLVER